MSDMGLEHQDSEVFRSATSLNGNGDMGTSSPGGSKCVIRKFCNGVRVPVFLADDNGNDSSNSTTQRTESQRTSAGSKVKGKLFGDGEVDLALMDLYTCPICMDPMIEVTATSCGHTFCRACLEEWSKIKPICPICSKEITHRIRLYNEDQFIEWLLRTNEDFPAELSRRLYEATKARMDKRITDQTSRNLLAKVRGKLDDLRISCKSKGVFGTLKNRFLNPATSATLRIQDGLKSSASRLVPSWPSERLSLIMWGIVIGIIATFAISKLWNGSNFFYYLYLSIKNYDGSIPAYLLEGPQRQATLGIGGTTLDGIGSKYNISETQLSVTYPETNSSIFNPLYTFLWSIWDFMISSL